MGDNWLIADTDKQLRKLYELSLLLSGEPDEIIRQIAGMIAEFFDVRVVVLTEIKNQELYFLCAHVDGDLQTGLGHIPLALTPCALVKEGKQEQFFDQVSDIFPQVDFLRKQKAFFYYGVPALDSTGNVISTTCLLDEKHHDLGEQDTELLRIFGQRIAMELERKAFLQKQRQTEEALHDSQSQLYGLTNISPAGIFRADIHGGYIYVNRSWCRFSGMDTGQAMGDGWISAIHPEDRRQVAEAWQQAVGEQRDFELEYRFLTPVNRITWVMARATLEKNRSGQATGFIGVLTDITDRKKQEIENESIRQKLVLAQNIAHLGFFEHDPETGSSYWSEEVYRILGTNPQQTKPGVDAFVKFAHADDVTTIREASEQLLKGQPYDIDYRIIRADGQESILHGEARLMIDEKTGHRKIMGTVQDISERKHVENALNALVEFDETDDLAAFYRNMVYHLARAYNARYAYIGLFSPGCTDRITLQAIWAHDHFGENFEYALAGTPCSDVLDGNMEMVPENAAGLYPEDSLLREMGIDSYYGAPLVTPSGRKIGLAAVMDTRPMHMGHWTKSILSLFAQQLASHIERSQIEDEIKASQKKLSSILENMQDVFYRTDSQGRLIMMSPSGSEVLGYDTDEVLGTPLADLYINPEEREKLLKILEQNDGRAHNFVTALRHKDGQTVWMSVNAQYYYDDTGNVLGVEGVARDITRQYLDSQQMRKMSSALEQTADMVLITDKNGVIEYVNPMFEKTTGYSKQELIGHKPDILKSDRHDHAFYKKLWTRILAGEVFTEIIINKKKDGSLFYHDETITPLKNADGEITHFIATGRDISQRMANEKHLQYIAHHDALTSLPNRVLFMDRIKRTLAHAKRNEKRAAVLFFDLDRFKNINDTLGHIVGDKLLIEIARRLKHSIREDDSIARLGGDEFAVLVDDITSENDVSQVAQKILTCLEKSASIDGHSLYTTASIGISLFPDDGDDADTLLKNADIAMYRAKDMGKNNYQFYSRDMSTRAMQRLAIENNLHQALENDEFVLYYQPQVDPANMQIVAVEALIRWRNPELGLISPDDFIPLLEETGLIIEVGEWVLDTACRQLRKWQDDTGLKLTISVNVSSRQFQNPDCHCQFIDITDRYNIPCERIELEITESILMNKQKNTIENINRLDEYGYRMAIDDFGTGYSSLSYLQHFRIDTLKIDRSFIRDIENNPDDAAITSAIIAMAHSLKLNIVAEGVENRQQLDFLQRQRCQLIQGYYFSTPLPADKMTELLKTGLRERT